MGVGAHRSPQGSLIDKQEIEQLYLMIVFKVPHDNNSKSLHSEAHTEGIKNFKALFDKA